MLVSSRGDFENNIFQFFIIGTPQYALLTDVIFHQQILGQGDDSASSRMFDRSKSKMKMKLLQK